VALSSETWNRALTLDIELTNILYAATAAAREKIFPPDDGRYSVPFYPHISLLYGRHDLKSLEQAAAQASPQLKSLSPTFTLQQLSLVLISSGEVHCCWHEVLRLDLARPRSRPHTPASVCG